MVTIGKNVSIAENCTIGDCVIGDQVKIGPGTIVEDDVEIGAQSIIGSGCILSQGTQLPPKSKIKNGTTLPSK